MIKFFKDVRLVWRVIRAIFEDVSDAEFEKRFQELKDSLGDDRS